MQITYIVISATALFAAVLNPMSVADNDSPLSSQQDAPADVEFSGTQTQVGAAVKYPVAIVIWHLPVPFLVGDDAQFPD